MVLKKKTYTFDTINTENAIVTENLFKIYNKNSINPFYAIKNVSLTIKKGEFVSIIGTSGSGKSTLLHMLAGVDAPSDGKVFINGYDIYSMKDKELAAFKSQEIGMVYQFFNLIPVMNVEENIAFPVISQKEEPDMNRVSAIINKLNLKGKNHSLPSQLSGGQQQRVSIGRILMASPNIILADEPTGNLDSKNSKEVIDLLIWMCKEHGRTLVIITHDKDIASLADRTICIEDGIIVSDTVNAGDNNE
ncbi:MAG: ABC transporter ATP-binding protein [Clostridia bacterium]|nr:ABC transporter ATP-binding protein [Clostridia bacterium]